MLLRVHVTKEFVTCETVFQFTTGDEMIFVHRSPKHCKIDGERRRRGGGTEIRHNYERARERAGGPREKKMQQATKLTPYDSCASWLLRLGHQFEL
jgi:hypothetical protein